MPLYGTLDASPWAASSPLLEHLHPEPWELKGATVLECRTEIDHRSGLGLVPRSLHPANPAVASFIFMQIPESPVGPFTFAQARISARAAATPLYFVLSSFCNNDAARKILAMQWGYPVTAAEVSLKELHYRATGSVVIGGRPVLNVPLVRKAPLPNTRFATLTTANLVRLGAERVPVLVGLSVELAYSRTDVGAQDMLTIDEQAGRCGALRPTNPMAITVGTANVTFSNVQFTADPTEAAETSLRQVAP